MSSESSSSGDKPGPSGNKPKPSGSQEAPPEIIVEEEAPPQWPLLGDSPDALSPMSPMSNCATFGGSSRPESRMNDVMEDLNAAEADAAETTDRLESLAVSGSTGAPVAAPVAGSSRVRETAEADSSVAEPLVVIGSSSTVFRRVTCPKCRGWRGEAPPNRSQKSCRCYPTSECEPAPQGSSSSLAVPLHDEERISPQPSDAGNLGPRRSSLPTGGPISDPTISSGSGSCFTSSQSVAGSSNLASGQASTRASGSLSGDNPPGNLPRPDVNLGEYVDDRGDPGAIRSPRRTGVLSPRRSSNPSNTLSPYSADRSRRQSLRDLRDEKSEGSEGKQKDPRRDHDTDTYFLTFEPQFSLEDGYVFKSKNKGDTLEDLVMEANYMNFILMSNVCSSPTFDTERNLDVSKDSLGDSFDFSDNELEE